MPVFRKDGKNVLFIHVPKCGGSTVEKAFVNSGYEMSYWARDKGPKTISFVRHCTPQHLHAEPLRNLFRLERFDVIFMIVRNPIARFRSEYVYRHKSRASVSASAKDVANWADIHIEKYRNDPYHLDNHFRPQAEFYLPGAQIYKLEDGLEAAFTDLNERFTLAASMENVQNTNDSGKDYGLASSDVEISPGLEDRLYDLYRPDFRKFDYSTNGDRDPKAAPEV